MPLTLKDIADMVGVAESTVSRAVNNKPGVGEDTRKEIMEIVRKYNFKPNQLAQGLAKQETHILALFLPDISNPAHTKIAKSVEQIANKKGYQLILCNTDNSQEKEKSYLELLERNQVDGAIIVGGDLTDEHIVNTTLRGDNLIVLINRLTEEVLIPTVLVDNGRGAYLATEHLFNQSIKRIAIVMGNGRDYLESEKLSGFKNAHNEYGIKLSDDLIIETEGDRDAGYRAFLETMELDQPPAGFFVTNEFLAIGLVEAIKMGGYLIPDDFAVTAYGDSILSSIVNPRLSVVADPLEELGKIAANNIIKLIKGESPEEVIKVLEPVLKTRDSSKPNIKREDN